MNQPLIAAKEFKTAWERVLNSGEFRQQYDRNNCGLVCAINALQLARMLKGQPILDKVYLAVDYERSMGKADGYLDSGLATFSGLLTTLNNLFTDYVSPETTVQASYLPFFENFFFEGTPPSYSRPQEQFNLADMQLNKGSSKILLGAVLLDNNNQVNLQAQHIMMVRGSTGSEVYLMEPQNPRETIVFKGHGIINMEVNGSNFKLKYYRFYKKWGPFKWRTTLGDNVIGFIPTGIITINHP